MFKYCFFRVSIILLFAAVTAALVLFASTSYKIGVFGNSFQDSPYAVKAGFAGIIYVALVADMISIVSKVRETSCVAGANIFTCSWEAMLIWCIVVPLMAGVGVAVVSFAGGTD